MSNVDTPAIENSAEELSRTHNKVYIAYPNAFKLLNKRLGATPEDIAAWVWLCPKDKEKANGNYLAAYLNAHELDPPPRFFYDFGDVNNIDHNYLSPLMRCSFLESDIINFQPEDYFITGELLIERWSEIFGAETKSFIEGKIEEGRLSDIHPICGGTQASFPNDEPDSTYGSYPPLEVGLFARSEIEKIEIEDFGMEQSQPIQDELINKKLESTTERKQRLKNWHQQEKFLKGERGSLIRTAKREGITRQTLSAILNRPD